MENTKYNTNDTRRLGWNVLRGHQGQIVTRHYVQAWGDAEGEARGYEDISLWIDARDDTWYITHKSRRNIVADGSGDPKPSPQEARAMVRAARERGASSRA